MGKIIQVKVQKGGLFPSPCGVLFLLMFYGKKINSRKFIGVSVSLRSIIHSYKLVKNSAFGGYYLAFPSPYGVSFILIYDIHQYTDSCIFIFKFPSPYGVSFILIRKKCGIV